MLSCCTTCCVASFTCVKEITQLEYSDKSAILWIASIGIMHKIHKDGQHACNIISSPGIMPTLPWLRSIPAPSPERFASCALFLARLNRTAASKLVLCSVGPTWTSETADSKSYNTFTSCNSVIHKQEKEDESTVPWTYGYDICELKQILKNWIKTTTTTSVTLCHLCCKSPSLLVMTHCLCSMELFPLGAWC